MDQDLAALRRACEADPTDELAARRYDAELVRNGKRDQVRDRIRLKFVCPLAWSELAENASDRGLRHCAKCDRDVHYVSSAAMMQEHVAAGHCVAFNTAMTNPFLEAMVDDPSVHSARVERSPCLVENKLLPGQEPPKPPPRPVTMGVPARVLPKPPPPPPPKPVLSERREAPRVEGPQPRGLRAWLARLFG